VKAGLRRSVASRRRFRSGVVDKVAFGNQLIDNVPMDAVAKPPPPERIAALRGFNRFYTRRIGVLHERLLGSGYGLAGSRVLWELAHLKPGQPA
jgi:hypothetical protein